jgi:hypothetical protein
VEVLVTEVDGFRGIAHVHDRCSIGDIASLTPAARFRRNPSADCGVDVADEPVLRADDGHDPGHHLGAVAYHFGLSARLLKSFYKRRMEPMSATMITTPLFADFTKHFPGGMIVVGPDAKRFTDEKFKTRHGKVPVNGCWLPLSTPCPMFMIFDHTLFSAGPLYDKNPSHGWTQIIERYDWSKDNSAEVAKGWIKTADSIATLASSLGLDPVRLAESVRS